MQRLSQMWSDTLKGLSAFSVRDRLLVGALATIVIMVLVIVAGLTGRTSTVALFPAGTAAQQIADAQAVAAAEGITVEPRSGMLYVAEEQKTRLLARLAEQNRLGSSAALLFDTLATKQNWMNSQRENDRWFLIAKQNELAKVIANFTGIKAAKVSIDVPDNPGMLNAYKRPTAHVTVTATEPLTTKKVNAIAGLVSGATAGLNRSDVRVADTESGQEFKPQAEGDFASSDYLEHVDKVESRIHAKIADALAYVRGAIVTVNAQVDMRKTTTSTNEVLPIKKGAAGSLSTPLKTTTDTTLSGSDKAGGAVPGAQANVQADITQGQSGGGGKNETNKEETEFHVAVGTRTEQTIDPRGIPTKINVTVSVPQEHIANIVRATKASGAAGAAGAAGGADEKISKVEMDTAFAEEQKRIAADLQPLVETFLADAEGSKAQNGTVVVSMIPVPFRPASSDGGSMVQAGGVAAILGSGGMGGLGGGSLIKQAVLVVLAVVALGMMFMLVRKSAKPLELPSAQDLAGVPPTLEGGVDIVGEADEGDTAMEGIELDGDRIRVKKMLEQVNELVKSNPSDAATLMNRWISRED